MEHPNEFCCPIACDGTLMNNPVHVLPCKHVFEYMNIEQWVIKTFNQEISCPLCRTVISHWFEPAYELRLQIEQYASIHKIKIQPLNSQINYHDLHFAAQHNDSILAEHLLQQQHNPNALDSMGLSPLHLAAKYDSLETAQVLLNHGADINLTDYMGKNALHFATENVYGYDIARFLLDNNIVICQDKEGNTPLHISVKNGNIIVEMLLADSTWINIPNHDTLTPLHIAAERGYIGIVNALLSAGADINIKDRWGNPPYNLAHRNNFNKTAELIKPETKKCSIM